MSTSSKDNAPASFLTKKNTLRMVYYNVAIMLSLGAGLYYVISSAANVQAAHEAEVRKTAIKTTQSPSPAAVSNISSSEDVEMAADSAGGENALADSGSNKQPAPPPEVSAEAETPFTDPRMIAYVLFAITMAGGLGGTLCNLRGIFEFTRDNQGRFPSYLELAFYLRPVSGVLCGLFTFFVSTFFAGALSHGDGSGWRTLDGMFPYIGIAFLAGFASQEFMERLKETARTLFGNGNAAPAAEPEPEPEPEPTITPDGGKESLHVGPEKGGRESLSGTSESKQARQPAPPPPRRPTPPRKMLD